MKHFYNIFFLIYLFSICASSAQTLNISGTVKDTSGNPISGVNVVIVGSFIGTSTNDNGIYQLLELKPGSYNISFSAVGLKSTVKINIELINKSLTLNVTLHNDILELGSIVVSASKYEQRVSDLPVSADVIPSNEFSQKNFSNFEDALRYAPGVKMTSDQISIRGSSGYSRGAGSRVVLAIDGIPMYTGDTGETIWETIPVAAIKRVEIIKGAVSSLYGSSAIGGVVNVITKDIPSSPKTYISSYIGFYDEPVYPEWRWTNNLRSFNGLTIAHSRQFQNFKLEASLTRLEDQSYEQNGFFHKYLGFFKGIYDFSGNSSLTFLASTFNKTSGNFIYWRDSRNALVPPVQNEGQVVNTNRYLFGLIYKGLLNENFIYNIKTSYYRNNWDDGSVPLNESTSNLYRLEVQSNGKISDNIILTSGIDGVTSNVKSTLFGNPYLLQSGIYTQADLSFNFPLILTLGIRYDFSKLDTLKSTNAISPKAGLNYKLTDKITLRSSFGTGFRAPSLAEAFTSTTASGITVKPNPGLKPEKNFTTDFGINYHPINELNFDASFFWNEYRDFIEPGVDPNDGFIVFSNLTKARIQGMELNSDFGILNNSLLFSVHYTYLWARNLNTNEPLKYRPRNTVYASVDYFLPIGEASLNKLNIGIDFRYWSRVEKIDEELINLGLVPDGNLRVPVHVFDFRTSYGFNFFDIPLKLFFNVKNIFNYNYVELIANLEPLRNYSLRIEFNL
jgi:outer membrane receptor for ferrienterochelin and colicins